MSKHMQWRRNDEGVALIAAIALMGIVSVLMVTIVSFSLREGKSTGRDRQRSDAVTSAEGGVDQMLATLENPVGPFPCSSTVTNTAAKPDTMTIATNVTYYDVTGAALTCPLASPVSAVQAFVTSTSTSNSISGGAPAKRTVTSLVRLKAIFANSLNSALYSNNSLQPFSQLDVTGNVGSDADVYSNGDVGCVNASGSIYAQGAINTSCTISVNGWAGTGVTSSASIGGDVHVSAPTGVANLSGTVGGKIFTNNGTGVTPSTLCTGSKCVRGAGSTTAPPVQPFPVINWDAPTSAAWASAGYTIVTLDTCGAVDSWLASNASSVAVPTLLRTACSTQPVNIDMTIRLKTNLAIVSDGGFYAKNGADYASADSTVRNFQLIQPYNTPLAPTCAADGIYFKNNASTASIAMLLYTPCNVEFKNNSTMYGQIYSGGSVYFKQHGSVGYRPVPAFGIQGGTVASYDVDVLFKREEASSS